MVLRESVLLVLAGIAIGVPVALACARLAASRLFGVGPADPLTFVGAAVVMVGVAAVASGVPSRRAARVDPLLSLRHE
jgi:ABC-type antimicrobial peptide transport system permease subunit